MRIKVSIPLGGDRLPDDLPKDRHVPVKTEDGEVIGWVTEIEVYDEIELIAELEIDRDSWVSMGIERGFAKEFCAMHDMAPMTDEEKALDYDDPCIPALRVWQLPPPVEPPPGTGALYVKSGP